MEYKEKTYLNIDTFHRIMKNVIYIKYIDDRIDYCKYIKDLINYKSKISQTVNDIFNYKYDKNYKQEVYSVYEEIEERYKKYINDEYSKLYYIKEIKFFISDSSQDTETIILKNGCLHNTFGPAHIIMNNNFYYIDGKEYEYHNWKSHPTIRQHKINKLINNIKS